MKILGISAYYHDSSSALLVDGTVVSAAQEERFTRVKHDSSFPGNAIKFCLDYAGLKLDDIDVVVFYEKPFLKFERILTSQIATFPKSLPMFLKTTPIWLKDKLNMRGLISKELNARFGCKPKSIKFVEHHLSHAAFAYCTSGYEDADVLVVDAVGEWSTTSIWHVRNGRFEIIKEQRFPDSIGMLYSAFTQFLGFKVNSDEYKVMGLAPYGNPNDDETQRFISLIQSEILSDEEGFALLNLSYFSYQYGDKMIKKTKWEKLFGITQRTKNDEITPSHKNLAYAIQYVIEVLLLKIVQSMRKDSNCQNLCICGGVALNCVANGLLQKERIYSNVYVPFAPGDCGCSVGAALAYDNLAENRSKYTVSPYTGPQYHDPEIAEVLNAYGLEYTCVDSFDTLCLTTAKLISEENIVGWYQGRMELGPRALGNRSILADARNPLMKDLVNSRIKFRESFRPFAPSVLEEDAESLFLNCQDSAYMMFTFPVVDNSIPAVTHVDGTARVQTVSKKDNELYYKLLKSFKALTGCPALLNTSFNVMGEPIVCTPEDAVKTFKKCGLDYLIIGSFIVKK